MRKIGGIFGRSVLGPLREHMAKVMDCLEVLHEALRCYTDGEFAKIEDFSKKVSKLEHDADIVKEGIRKSLSKSIFASSTRDDILDLIHKADDISDACEDVVKFLTLHNVKLPEDIRQDFVSLTDKVCSVGRNLNRSIDQACQYEEREVLTEKLGEILTLLEEVEKGEWETDQIQLSLVKKVFGMADVVNPIDVFFLMNLSRQTVEIADHMQNVADCLQRLVS